LMEEEDERVERGQEPRAKCGRRGGQRVGPIASEEREEQRGSKRGEGGMIEFSRPVPCVRAKAELLMPRAETRGGRDSGAERLLSCLGFGSKVTPPRSGVV
jgi:hypothetical protein